MAASKESGFSLLEVMVSSAIMGMVLLVLLQVLSGALKAQQAARSHTQAVMVAEKVLEQYCAAETLGGAYQGQEGKFTYQVRIDPLYRLAVRQFEKHITCVLLQITVSWQERGKTKSLALQTARTVAQKKS